jgi:hypothetical protein
MEQYLEDRDSSAPQTELDIYLTKMRITFAADTVPNPHLQVKQWKLTG